MLTGDLQDNERVYDDQDIVRRLLRERPTGDPYVLVTDTSSPRMPRHTQKPGSHSSTNLSALLQTTKAC